MARYQDSYFPPYVPVAQRRRRAEKKLASLRKAGHDVSPVGIEGRKITTTFWGEAWCKNLEAYSDYASRLPRGRSYVRNGSVLDLRIEAGQVRALVSGTDFYNVDISIDEISKRRWKNLKAKCSGQIGSLVELLQGSISNGVLRIVTQQDEGLFPSPEEITLNCSCPDRAEMCKHVAAALYGIGSRLDHAPELLFVLRGVDPSEMVDAAIEQSKRGAPGRSARALKTDELSSVFGVDIDIDLESTPARAKKASAKKASAKKTSAKKTSAKKTSAKKTSAKEGFRSETRRSSWAWLLKKSTSSR